MFIFTKTWVPSGPNPSKAVVVFVHDIAEHCERYQSLFTCFASKGIEVQAFDLPGFGETGARAECLGVTGGYDTLIKEMDNAVDRACSSHPSKPVFLMGHGMGGALVLNYVCGLGQRTASLGGIISSSPYLKPTMAGAGSRFPSTYNRLAKLYPRISVRFPVAPQELTRDRAEQERYLADGLICESVSLQCLGDMIYQGQKVLTSRLKYFPCPLPTLLLHGTDDPICSYKATALLSSQLLKQGPTNFLFKSWRGNRHDPHWDIDALAVRSELSHWICGNSRHFVGLPLEPGMVRYDSLKSIRSLSSTQSANESKLKKDKAKSKNKGKKAKGKDKSLDATTPATPPEPPSSSSLPSSIPVPVPTIAAVPPADAEPIQDLEGLRKQQQLRLQKAEEKRREYSMQASDMLLSENSTATATATIECAPNNLNSSNNEGLDSSVDTPSKYTRNNEGLDLSVDTPSKNSSINENLDSSVDTPSSDSSKSEEQPSSNGSGAFSMEEPTMRELEQESKLCEVSLPSSISLDHISHSIDRTISTMSLPLVSSDLTPSIMTPVTELLEDAENKHKDSMTEEPPKVPEVEETEPYEAEKQEGIEKEDKSPDTNEDNNGGMLKETLLVQEASPSPEATLLEGTLSIESGATIPEDSISL
ncbi:hypothetical protein BG004_007584 [Podila humilis]|nr:hypothetical protein BG004_007584 [Podila humilis]